MTVYSILLSIFVGSFLGILYGLLFLYTKALPLAKKTAQTFWQATIPSILRLFIIGVILFYILRIPFIHPILMMVPFLLIFWLIVVKYNSYG
jgi:hypothetical protein